MQNTDSLLRELNHRVQNNFQIIVSLMSLKKRSLPPERQEDIRFLQENVQSMAVAYRLVYATGDMTEVSVDNLLIDIVTELRQIAGLTLSQVQVTGPDVDWKMHLDQAIAFGLYLAVLLPPFLEHAAKSEEKVEITASVEDDALMVSIRGQRVEPDALRRQLADAYVKQLHAELVDGPSPTGMRFRVSSGRPWKG